MCDPSENGLFGTSDYDQIEDESFPPLPPPLSPGGANFDEDAEANGEAGELSKLADVPVAKRRTVKRPQPKLDSQRLLSERGLPALRTLFSDIKFKGKGHEAEDLKVLMKKMENWAHRLYPKLQFEDFIDKLEALGNKKEIQTCLKRIRLDMPLTHEDFMGNDGDEVEVRLQEDADPFEDRSLSEDPFIHSTPAPAPVSLTEEQQQQIERNKQLALERRLSRQKQLESAYTDEPAVCPTVHHLSHDDLKNLDQATGDTDTPLKQTPVATRSTPQDNKCDGPVPERTDGSDNDSD